MTDTMDLFSADDVGGGGGGGSSGRAETRMMSVPRAKRLDWQTVTAPKPLSLELALNGQGESAVCPVSLVEQEFMMNAAWRSSGIGKFTRPPQALVPEVLR